MASSSQDDQTQNEQSQDEQSQDEQQSNALEWSVAILGGIIVLGTIGYLIYKLFSGAADPPDLQVTLGDAKDQGQEMLVPVTVKNNGGSVAIDTVVEICSATEECAQLTFEYVPHASVREGFVGFSKPMSEPLSTRVVSYREP